jgi:hypothetical protein
VVVLDSSRYIDGLFANDPPIEMEKDDVVGWLEEKDPKEIDDKK